MLLYDVLASLGTVAVTFTDTTFPRASIVNGRNRPVLATNLVFPVLESSGVPSIGTHDKFSVLDRCRQHGVVSVCLSHYRSPAIRASCGHIPCPRASLWRGYQMALAFPYPHSAARYLSSSPMIATLIASAIFSNALYKGRS